MELSEVEELKHFMYAPLSDTLKKLESLRRKDLERLRTLLHH